MSLCNPVFLLLTKNQASAFDSNEIVGRTKPSIPSRFKPPKRKNKAEPRGFGSSNRRFQQTTRGVPGPASYPKIYDSEILKHSPSISRKGHFASKVPRLPEDSSRSKTPGFTIEDCPLRI